MQVIYALMQGVVPVDPTNDPTGFISQVTALWSSGGWAIALLLGLLGLLEVAVKLGKTVKFLAWLDQGRATIVAAGAIATLTAMLNVLLNHGMWVPALWAAIGTVLTFIHLDRSPPQTPPSATTPAVPVANKLTPVAIVLLVAFAAGACGGKTKGVVLAAGQCILDDGALATVAGDLTEQDYAKLVDDLVTKIGPDAVSCALRAIAASQKAPANAEPSLVGIRARELLAKYKR